MEPATASTALSSTESSACAAAFLSDTRSWQAHWAAQTLLLVSGGKRPYALAGTVPGKGGRYAARGGAGVAGLWRHAGRYGFDFLLGSQETRNESQVG